MGNKVGRRNTLDAKEKGITIMDELYKEIDLIQSCITRMADNSFRLKELYISLISIALTVMLSQNHDLLIMGAFLIAVTIVFWGLDAFYLKMETLYRWKYEWVIEKRPVGERSYLYNLDPHNKDMWLNALSKNDCIIKFAFSTTLKPLYGTMIVISIILLLCG